MAKPAARLQATELQFKFAVAIATLTATAEKPLSGTLHEFTWGRYRITRDELALSLEQEQTASSLFEHTASFLMMQQLDASLDRVFGHKRFHFGNADLSGASWIARLIRNAFAHDPLAPVWLIDRRVQGKVVHFRDIIHLDTTKLKGRLNRSQYGGPLALLRFSQACRETFLEAASAAAV